MTEIKTQNVEATTIFFLNEKGNYEVNSIVNYFDEIIIVASIFKNDLKGIARTYVEFEASTCESQERLDEIFSKLQNKGLRKMQEEFRANFEFNYDFDAERQACREAIRKMEAEAIAK